MVNTWKDSVVPEGSQENKGSAVENYRPITCLPPMWKLMTGTIADECMNIWKMSICCQMNRKVVGEKVVVRKINY